ncbi:MAG TPA: nuclear transport factor 2 family protein [Pseudolabrys sp.]|jgi:ketosteroid isomerase-like protein|nr:nuclear transport factor 2 family protein [Pseudolabrys sp.]
MRNRSALVVIFVATVASLPSMGLAQSDPVAVFRQAIDARNRGDIVAMMALFTDEAVREDGSCQPPCVGLAAVRASFQKNIDEHFQSKVTSAEGSGDTVTARAEISSDAFRARGIEKRMTSYTVKLRNGKIVSWTSPLPPQSPAKTN